MKQKIFLFLVVGSLITSPALAAHATPNGETHVDNVSDLGTYVHMGFNTPGVKTEVTLGGFTLTIDAAIVSAGTPGAPIAYIYSLSSSGPGALVNFGVGNSLFPLTTGGHSWGYVAGPVTSPFSGPASNSPFLFFQFSGFSGDLLVYATAATLPDLQVSPAPPPPFQLADMFFETVDGQFASGFTVGPLLGGEGASFGNFDVPEASSLLLLTFGLLGGGVLRLRINHKFHGKRK